MTSTHVISAMLSWECCGNDAGIHPPLKGIVRSWNLWNMTRTLGRSHGTVSYHECVCPFGFALFVSAHIHLPSCFLPWIDTTQCLCQTELPNPRLPASTPWDKSLSFLYKLPCLEYFVIAKGNGLRQVFTSSLIAQNHHCRHKGLFHGPYQPPGLTSWQKSRRGHWSLCSSVSEWCEFVHASSSLLPAPSPMSLLCSLHLSWLCCPQSQQ